MIRDSPCFDGFPLLQWLRQPLMVPRCLIGMSDHDPMILLPPSKMKTSWVSLKVFWLYSSQLIRVIKRDISNKKTQKNASFCLQTHWFDVLFESSLTCSLAHQAPPGRWRYHSERFAANIQLGLLGHVGCSVDHWEYIRSSQPKGGWLPGENDLNKRGQMMPILMSIIYTLKYLGSEMVAPQGSAGAGSEMVPGPL